MAKLNKYISDSYQNFFDSDLSNTDPDLFNSIKLELERQQEHIELIASENIVSKAVLDAQGSIMTNKYAEGYPSKRYYGGCEFVDKAEALALERVKKLFDCKYANVQPHSGASGAGAHSCRALPPGDSRAAGGGRAPARAAGIDRSRLYCWPASERGRSAGRHESGYRMPAD